MLNQNKRPISILDEVEKSEQRKKENSEVNILDQMERFEKEVKANAHNYKRRLPKQEK